MLVELGASDEQADFPVVYTNTLAGQPGLTTDLGLDRRPLFEVILRHIPAPNVDVEAPLQMLVSTLGYDECRGTTGEALADPEQPAALPAVDVEDPTVRMTFGANTSPFAGQEGRWMTSRKLRE